MIILYLILPVAVLGLSILIASLHMIAPDHWTPILSYSISKKLKIRKTGFISFSLGLIHGIFSAILSFAIAIIGLYFFPELYLKIFAAALLIFVALYIIMNARHEEKVIQKLWFPAVWQQPGSQFFSESVLRASLSKPCSMQ